MVTLSETELHLFIIITLFLALSSFLTGLILLANFAFLPLITATASLSIAAFLTVYVARSNSQIPQKHYPTITGVLNVLLGSVIMYTCLPNFASAVHNLVNYSGSLGTGALNLASFMMTLFGTVASVSALAGGLSSIMKKNFNTAQLGSYMVLGWFATWYISIITPSIVLLGAPTPFASTPTQFAVNLAVFTTLFLLPSLLCVILIRRSKMEFA